VGQFVLTAALRIQTAKQNAKEFPGVSSERSFADFLLGSLVLHFCVYHFIN
jgi:oligosaccharyltransferase complex subunit epsilon